MLLVIMDNLQTVPNTANKNIPITAIINYANLGLKQTEIAKLTGCTQSNINQRLESEGYNRDFVIASRKAEAETLTYAQQKLLNGIIEGAEKAPFQSKVFAYGVLFDKRQLLEGKATSITGYEGLPDDGLLAKMQTLMDKATKIGIKITEIVGEIPAQLRDAMPQLPSASHDALINTGHNLEGVGK
jgi:predicted transcriptional regulator